MEHVSRRGLLAIVLLALIHSAFFMFYQRPDWETQWDDQVGYQRLGHVLATTGRFTRFPESQPFVPETIRTPGYPLLVAATYRVFGESHFAVAAVQAALFAGICLVVFATAARLASRRVALAAAVLTALFPPIPYYGALVLTEVLATLLVTTAIWTAVVALQEGRRSWIVATGALLGLATLTRPTTLLFPIALVVFIAGAAALQRDWRRALPWGWMLISFAVVLSPWLAYNVVYVHRLTISPAGGIGRATWEASWQGTWPGRVQADLTRLADTNDADVVLDERVRRLAADNGFAADPMLTYVHQWRDIRKIWVTPTDPRERANARIAADDEYWRVGVANISRDRTGHALRRITVGTFVLWAAEIPIRYSDINSVRPLFIRMIWLAQAALAALALLGLVVLAGRGHLIDAAPMAALIVYVTTIHLPMLAEARYSLPAKPTLIVLAVIALAELVHRMLPQTGDYLP
jgi:hypothetical protein